MGWCAAAHPEIETVKIYASRAIDTASPGSDINLAIYTASPREISGMVRADLDDLRTPYLFDVTDYYKITHPPLREHIDRVGKILYSKTIER